MPLKITLKPRERMIIGGAVITNGNSKTELTVDNKVPILRRKDIMTEEEATTPARRIYFVVQLMYIDPENLSNHHRAYWEMVGEFLKAMPSQLELFDKISEQILKLNYYQALKLMKKVIANENEVLGSV